LNCWGKCGAVPLNYSALQSNQVRHEVVVEVDGTVDVVTYPKENLLYNLEMENKMCFSVMTSKGYYGNQLKIHAPRVAKSKTPTTTKPHTFERVKVISNVKAVG